MLLFRLLALLLFGASALLFFTFIWHIAHGLVLIIAPPLPVGMVNRRGVVLLPFLSWVILVLH